MTTTTKEKKTPKRRAARKNDLPDSAELLVLSGREYMIVPVEEFQEWDEDRQLAALVAQRLAEDEEIISFDEMERRLDAKKKKRT